MSKKRISNKIAPDTYEARLVAAQNFASGAHVRHRVTCREGRFVDINLGFALPEVWIEFESDSEVLVPVSCNPLDLELVAQVPLGTYENSPLIENELRETELSSAVDVLPAVMSEAEARQCIEAIKGHVVSIRALILDLEERRGWEALGYSSMTACLVGEFPDDSKTKLIRTLEAGRIERHIQEVPIGTYPESQLRPLNKLAPEQWKPALAKAHQLAGNGRLTAAQVAQSVNEILSSARSVKQTLSAKYKPGDVVRIKCAVGALSEQKAWDGCWGIVQSTGNISCVRVLVGGKEVDYMAVDLDWDDTSDAQFRDHSDRILALWQTELEPIEQTILKELQRRYFLTDLEVQIISLMEAKRLSPHDGTAVRESVGRGCL